jgi:hypothetical protein
MKNLIVSILLASTLAACVSGKPPADTYTGKSGAVTTIETDREACIKACNDDYARCGDTDAARRGVSPNIPAGLFGAQADCREDLKNCLPRCKGL